VLLNVVYDKTKDILYVGSNDKGIYEVRLDNMIDYSLFQGNAVIGFENLESKNNITYNRPFHFKS
jgi:hypothetical protein